MEATHRLSILDIANNFIVSDRRDASLLAKFEVSFLSRHPVTTIKWPLILLASGLAVYGIAQALKSLPGTVEDSLKDLVPDGVTDFIKSGQDIFDFLGDWVDKTFGFFKTLVKPGVEPKVAQPELPRLAQTREAVINDSMPDVKFGSLSSSQEGEVGSAVYDRSIRHWAYGKYQFDASTTGLKSFLKQSPYAAELLKAGPPESPEFAAKWKEIAQRDPKGFEASQDAVAATIYLTPLESVAKKLGFNFASPVIREVILSASIQHGQGNATSILKDAAAHLPQDKPSTDKEQVAAIYAARRDFAEGAAKKKGWDSRYKSSILNRYDREEKIALAMIEPPRPQANTSVASDSSASPKIAQVTVPSVQSKPEAQSAVKLAEIKPPSAKDMAANSTPVSTVKTASADTGNAEKAAQSLALADNSKDMPVQGFVKGKSGKLYNVPAA